MTPDQQALVEKVAEALECEPYSSEHMAIAAIRIALEAAADIVMKADLKITKGTDDVPTALELSHKGSNIAAAIRALIPPE
jgi:hypothetical protein